jgi:hypothetical protein
MYIDGDPSVPERAKPQFSYKVALDGKILNIFSKN